MSVVSAPSKAERFKEEMQIYVLVSIYLFACFSVLMIYEASLGTGKSGTSVQWSLALVKALVLGKFILVGKMLSVGKRADAHPLLHRIILKSLALLLLLVLFKGLEELLVGWYHGETLAAVIDEFFQLSLIQVVAPLLIMLLILIPLVAVSEIYKLVGAERLHKLLITH